ncbi:trace amine-associated receptor 1 [Trichonephila clavata]|uniref:Trace amine-associated receptor 1 n=1 Tax=Trichonephila clavata TaxID=2740835 RepID=A0A8X6IDI2_TRICU|nr:trace amine-associated receptor 1 [Trichonephila clavata]
MKNSQDSDFDLISKLYNETVKYDTEMNPQYKRYFASSVVGSLATVFIALVAIAGNLAVILASIWNEALKVQTGNKLIMYLSAIDILTSVYVMIPSAIAVACDYWPLGTNVCRISTAFNYLCSCSSCFIIACISFDRAIAVTYPLKYRTSITDKIMFIFCSVVFSVSFTAALLGIVPNWFGYEYSLGVCSVHYTTITDRKFFYIVIGGAISCFYFPALVVGVCSAVILITAKRVENSIRPLFVKRHLVHPVNSPHMRKSIISMIVVFLVYYICFTPYAIIKQLKGFFGINVPPWCNYFTTICIFASSAVNPFIYAILRKDYRSST